jgi:hypothetical protein
LYHFRYKTTSAAAWTIASTNLPSINITGLSAGTSYNYGVEAVCSSGPSGYCGDQTFTTIGNGYCTVGGQSTAQEYLSLVWIGGIINQTTSNNGYGDYTNLSTPLTQGSTVNGYLSAFLTYGLTENYSIWIDYNQDNDFNDAGEQAVNISSDFMGYIAVNFTVPANALPGPTRMRVMMRYGSAPTPCGLYPRGETEDYTVVISTPPTKQGNLEVNPETNTDLNSLIEEITISPNPFDNNISIQLQHTVAPVLISIYDTAGKLQYKAQLAEAQNELNLSGLRSGLYFLNVIKEGRFARTVKIIKK